MKQDHSKPKVLYVDDEEDNLLVFKSSFRRHYKIDTTSSVQQAYELARSADYDLIISDQRMPDQSGVEFLKSLPETLMASRIIMTGYSDIEAVIDALNAGTITKYVRKPWNKTDLKTLLDQSLSKRSLQQPTASQTGVQNQNDPIKYPADENLISQIEAQRQELELLRNELEETKESVQLLGEIGQEITSTLNLHTILNAVYENVNQLMDASVFGIGIFDAERQTIEYRLAIDKGKKYQPYRRSMEDKDQFPVWCIENKREIFINDVAKEYHHYIRSIATLNAEDATLEDGTKAEIQHSLIYMPLMVKEKLIGLITVQSYKKNAYSGFHLNTLRNIAIYVASALENARTYLQIEEQKEEIEIKNNELEQKVEERTEQLRIQKDELEDTFTKLKLLTEIGHEITSTLHLDTILNTIYKNVNTLMDASIFGIGIYDPEEKAISYQLAIENGQRYQPYKRSMNEKNQFPVWCIERKKEIFINDVHKEYGRYIQNYKDANDRSKIILEDGSTFTEPLSLIYIPLLFNNQPIGVLSVQSFRKYAYNQYHLDILRSLASYITTAIQNANSYTKMTEAFEQLKSAQTKLVESEKMASLGVLTAGVAHEINNPVNFISGGIQSLNENYQEIKNVLQELKKFAQNPGSAKIQTELLRITEMAELDDLLPEMEELIHSIMNGVDRTSEIVKGLRNFSRLDEHDKKIASIEEGIDNTLVILSNQLKNRIEVVKNYGNIPEIICFPGQLNQVFMNILYNAADAIKGKGRIEITTYVDDNNVMISFKDSGKGMSEAVKSRIFEPFFTTKAVGKGTGLGLSISYGIIEKHQGSIQVESEEGKGTTFIIRLPLKK